MKVFAGYFTVLLLLLTSGSSCRTRSHQISHRAQDMLEVTVLGAVNSPGAHQLPDEFYTSIEEVVDLAGGLAPEADTRQIKLARDAAGGATVRILTMDSPGSIRSGDVLTIARVMPGHARIWVCGEAVAAGREVMHFRHTQRPPTIETLVQRGGFTSRANPYAAHILRNVDGTQTFVPVSGNARLGLKDGDIVVVPALAGGLDAESNLEGHLLPSDTGL